MLLPVCPGSRRQDSRTIPSSIGDGGRMKHLFALLIAVSALAPAYTSASARPFTDPRAERSDAIDQAAALEPRDPACHARTLVSAGGGFPHNPHKLALC